MPDTDKTVTDIIQNILNQAPEGVTAADVEDAYNKNNENVVDTLAALWELPVKNTAVTSEKQDKWQGIRDVCAAYEAEMQNFMNQARKQCQ